MGVVVEIDGGMGEGFHIRSIIDFNERFYVVVVGLVAGDCGDVG